MDNFLARAAEMWGGSDETAHPSSERASSANPPIQPSSLAEHDPIPSTSQQHDDPSLLRHRATRRFALRQKYHRSFQNNTVEENIYDVKWDQTVRGTKVKEVRHEIESLFTHVLEGARQSHKEHDLARIYINHPSLHKPIIVPPMPLEEINTQTIMDQIDNVLQSNESLPLDEQFQIHLGLAHIPEGAGKNAIKITRVQGAKNDLWKKRSIVTIKNTDQLCLARSIVVARAKLQNHPKYTEIMKGRKIQTNLAQELHTKANVPTDRPATLNDVPKFERAIKTQIIILSAVKGNRPSYVGTKGYKQVIYLYMSNPSDQERNQGNSIGHFDAVVNIKGLLGVQNWCSHCQKPFKNKNGHRCIKYCPTCQSEECEIDNNARYCPDCHLHVRSNDCFHCHKLNRYVRCGKGNKRKELPSLCESYRRCLRCQKLYRTEEESTHVCGAWTCTNCKKTCFGQHECYVRANAPKKVGYKYIDFDFECEPNDAGHIPNFVVAYKTCQACVDIPYHDDKYCATCGEHCLQCTGRDKPCLSTEQCGIRGVCFEGSDTAHQFCSWLFQKKHQHYVARAHNARAYDAIFILAWLFDNGLYPECIYSGAKIMHIHVKKGLDISIIDSLNFLPLPLADLPKAFGLTELKKGYFPHFFNKTANFGYVGPYPSHEMYGIDSFSSEKREDFLEWYKAQEGKVFNFREELESYCRSDVDILQRACMQFRNLMIDITGRHEEQTVNGQLAQTLVAVDPFQYLTIASVCMAIFRAKCLPEEYQIKLADKPDTLFTALIRDGQLLADIEGKQVDGKDLNITEKHFVKSAMARVNNTQVNTHSKISITWLEWEAQRRGVFIQHALNTGEHTVPNAKGDGRYRLDGFHQDPDTGKKTAFEFYGCLWHGCQTCFLEKRTSEPYNKDYPKFTHLKHPHTGQSMSELYAITKERETYLKSRGYTLVTKWEHDFHYQLSVDPDLQDFIETQTMQERLKPRDAYFGGRTDASKLYHEVTSNESILYRDVTSMYPAVMKQETFPLGHPEIITRGPFQNINEYFGLAKVRIIPPHGLFNPVLPVRLDGKLLFPLCYRCACTQSQDPCRCSEAERSFIGTWTTVELQKAVEKGYRIESIFEVYHWAQSTNNLFTDYVDLFLRLKQQASGYPSWANTDELKEQYVRDYLEHEGIELDPAQIKYNPSLRFVSKLCLNSMYGKLAQRSNLRQNKVVHTPEDFYACITDPCKRVADFHIIKDDVLQVEYDHDPDFIPESIQTNIYLAAFITSYARLRLYDLLDKLGDRVLYCDTDSVIYIHRTGDPDLPLGSYLGQLTDELASHDFIIAFIAGGPKNYAYLTAQGKTVCKIRGFTLNHTNSLILNFESMKELILHNQHPQQHPITLKQIKKNKKNTQGSITIINKKKICRNRIKRTIYNREEEKSYRLVYNKRAIDKTTYITYPYGY